MLTSELALVSESFVISMETGQELPLNVNVMMDIGRPLTTGNYSVKVDLYVTFV